MKCKKKKKMKLRKVAKKTTNSNCKLINFNWEKIDSNKFQLLPYKC